MRWSSSVLVVLTACGSDLKAPPPADRVTVRASWTITNGECPAQTRVAITTGGETAVAPCEDGGVELGDLDPATNVATARLLDVVGAEILRATLDLAAPEDRVLDAEFSFTLPKEFGFFRARVLWAIGSQPPTEASCLAAGATDVRVVFGSREAVIVPCATGFAQFDNTGGMVPVTVELRGAGGAVLESKSLTMAVTDHTQTTVSFLP